MGNYRSKLDIIADILKVANRRAKKTQIMYQANLSHRLLIRYLNVVRKACLVSFDSKENRFVLTSKGKKFLESYKEYSRRNKHVEKQLSDVNNKRKVLEKLCSSKPF